MSVGNYVETASASMMLDSGSPVVSPSNIAGVHSHAVQFYEEDRTLVDRISAFAGSALGAGNACIIIATAPHGRSLSERLIDFGINVDQVMGNGRLVILDAAETLKLFVVDGWPESGLFNELMNAILSPFVVAEAHERVQISIFGEMVALLWEDGNPEAAVRLEQMWNDLAKKYSFSLLCAYSIRGFCRKEDELPFQHICAEHSEVMPCESYGMLPDESKKLLMVSELQQKAQMLQAVAEEREHMAIALSEELEELRKLHELSLRVTQLEPAQIMHMVLSAVAALHHTELGLFFVRNTSSNELEVAASLGFAPEFLQCVSRFPSGGGACGASMESRERVVVEDTETDPSCGPYLEASRLAGFRAVHSTPLLNRSGELIAILSVHLRRPRKISIREMRLMDLYAQMAASAIENSQLLHETQAELARRKSVEDALSKSEEFSRSIVESSVDCIKVLDTDGRLIYMSPPGQRALGISDINSVLHRSWVSFWDVADRERAAKAMAVAQEGGVGHFEGPLSVRGKTTWWDVNIAPMFNEAGEIEAITAISRETTELRLAHAALMQSEKLAAAGRLAATIAHEINNPLESVTNFIYLAKTSNGLPEDVYGLLNIADKELARVGHIAQQTLGFYRDTSNPRLIKLAELIKDVVSIYERKLQYKQLTLEQHVDEDLHIFARKGDLKQILTNLLTNAIDATLNGGHIVLRGCRSKNWQNGVAGVRIIVADNGEGMSRETQAKAFSAFFTTKADVGTGIGLWVTKNILERQGGSIKCRSSQRPGAGTVMNVFLPGVEADRRSC